MDIRETAGTLGRHIGVSLGKTAIDQHIKQFACKPMEISPKGAI